MLYSVMPWSSRFYLILFIFVYENKKRKTKKKTFVFGFDIPIKLALYIVAKLRMILSLLFHFFDKEIKKNKKQENILM